MNASLFIASKLRFKGRIAVSCIAVSFLVMILAVSISSGFRKSVREGVASVCGDIMVTPPDMNYIGESSPLEICPSYLPHITSIEGIASVTPVVYRAGIVKKGEIIHGVLFKGVPAEPADSVSPLSVSVPAQLADILDAGVGDELQTYFVGERVKVRKFRIESIYGSILGSDDQLIIYADIADMQRLNGWGSDSVSSFEVKVGDRFRNEEDIKALTEEAGAMTLLYSSDGEAPVVCTSSVSRYPQLFDWLNLIDFNVAFILILMTVVAGFNMISGLLILLFENISTIGILKSLGMRNAPIAGVFLASASSLVLKGMLAGNVLAFILCAIQAWTRIITLDPANYFVSYVPVHVDILKILAADTAAYLVIMLLLLLPSLFISKIDPAKTVRMG